MSKTSKRRKGAAMLEFALSTAYLIPLLLGTFVYGFRLVRSLDMQQITGDLGHMYIKGVDFRNSGPVQNATTLAAAFNLTSSGTSLLIFSQIRIATQADCDAANPSKKGQPCTNLGDPVYVEQLEIGNTNLQVNGKTAASAFGAPTPLQGDKTVGTTDFGNTIGVAAGDSTAKTGFASIMTLKPGETAYVVEMLNTTAELNIKGMTGSPQVYARSVY
jgi:hypothetical protein